MSQLNQVYKCTKKWQFTKGLNINYFRKVIENARLEVKWNCLKVLGFNQITPDKVSKVSFMVTSHYTTGWKLDWVFNSRRCCICHVPSHTA